MMAEWQGFCTEVYPGVEDMKQSPVTQPLACVVFMLPGAIAASLHEAAQILQ